jgi:23S rRNA (adenine2503-C2)-methyltransferase
MPERIPLPLASGLQPVLAAGPAGLRDWLQQRGWPAWHARQVFRWIFQGRAQDFAQMTDLPRELRIALSESFRIFSAAVAEHHQARDGTHKLILRLADGEHVECVLLQEAKRRTACISTQVGCGMGCVFCASGLGGLVRNLAAHEILEELILLRNLLPRTERLSHIVVMGMGEPLANLDALVQALDVAASKEGLGIGARHVTISTVGLPSRIRRLADLGKQYHLAVSLHAATDPLRTQIVPTNVKTGLKDILAAADYFFERTGRQVTFEYVLLAGINDRRRDAEELSRLLRGRCALVNLIPFNEVPGLPYRRPSDASLRAFVDQLRRSGLVVKVRKRKGSEIEAACGQLRRRREERLAQAEPSAGTSAGVCGLTL